MQIGGAGGGGRGSFALLILDDEVGWVVGDRLHLDDLQFAFQLLGFSERAVREACQVSAPRTHLEFVTLFPNHGAARDSQGPAVQRFQVSRVPAHTGRFHRRLAVFDQTDVGTGPTDFQKECVGSFQKHQCRGHSSSRT